VHAIGALLRARSTTDPLLLVLDDLHWADPASLAVVEELLATVPELRMVLLATYRSNLRPLRPDDARRLAAELATGAELAHEQTERVLERAAGNPLFLEELLHGERGSGTDQPHRLPASIHEMLLARLDALPAEARRALQVASVVGMEFTESIVTALAEAGAATIEDALRTLQRAELVRSREGDAADRTFVFRHPLIHEVAYGSLLTSTRRAMHGRVGRWLADHGGEDRIAELARHFQRGDEPAKARRYLRLAGERAHELNATREAYEWFMAAAEAYADEPEHRAEMLEAAAQDIHLLGQVDKAVDIQAEAVDRYAAAGNDRASANARRWLGRFHWLLGDPAEAERQIDLAIAGLERHGPSPELAMAYSFRAQSLMLVPEFEAGEHWARRAIEVAEATDGRAALVHAYNNLGTCLIGRADAQGIDYLLRSRDLALELHLPDDVGRAYTNLSNQGSRIFPLAYEEMDRFLAEGVAFSARTVPDGIFDRWTRAARGEFLLVTGRWRQAEEVLFALDEQAAEAYLRGEVLGLRGLLFAYRGRYDEAAAMTADVMETAQRVGDLQAVMPAFVTQAVIRFGLGDDAAAVRALAHAIEHRGEIGEHTLSTWTTFEGVDGLTAALRRDPGSPAVRDGIELLASFSSRIAPAVAQAGDLVQVEVRHAMFGAAVEQLGVLARSTGMPLDQPMGTFPGRAGALTVLDREHRRFDAARVRLWLAEEAHGSPDLAEAIAVFDELGAHPYLERGVRGRA
jgi:tetratricopeptide (TPR) repeat protein